MGQLGEWFIMIIAIVIFVLLAYRSIYRWLHAPSTISKIKLGKGGRIKDDDPNVMLLRKKGYIVLSGRHTISVAIELDEEMMDKSANLYVDYVAEKKGLTYIVKYERERSPIEWTNQDMRDRLLVYSLLLPDMAGILYINHKEGTLRKVAFHYLE